MIPRQAADRVLKLGGRGSALHQEYRVYLDYDGVASKVRLWALEPHDLALTKLERSIERDIRDVIFLAKSGLIVRDTLVARFETELEPYITGRTPSWHRTTLEMWIDSCWPK